MAVQSKQPITTGKFREMDRKRWLVRYLVLASIAVILGIKIYLVVYFVDFAVGFYSVLVSFVLFNLFFLSWVKFRDPFISVKDIVIPEDKKPMVTIMVPVKNEEDNIRNCVESCINSTYTNKETIVVNDGSTDGTAAILDEIRKEASTDTKLRIIHLSKSVGKKAAIEIASQIAKGEIYVMMDSDCDLYFDAVDNAVKIFYADRRIGAVTGHARVRNSSKNTLLKIEDVWFDGQFRLLKGMETVFSSLTCCSGALSIYRREAVHDFLYTWAHDRFLGIENFKFATDRRLTAYVLGAKPEDVLKSHKMDHLEQHNEDKAKNGYESIPILQTGEDDLKTMKSSSDPDQDEKTKDRRRYAWNLVYSPSVRVTAGVPTRFIDLIRQQIRWRKSFIRSLPATGGIYWRRPLYAAFMYYLVLGLKLTRPLIVLKLMALIFSGDLGTVIFYVAGLMYTGMLYGIDSRLRNPGYPYWLYRPLFTFISTFVLSWLIYYAAITIKKEAWR